MNVDLVVWVIKAQFDANRPSKRPCTRDLLVVSGSVNTCAEDVEVHKVCGIDLEPHSISAGTSRVSSNGLEEQHITSTVIPKDILDQFKEGEQRLKKDLKDLSLEDHVWYL